MDPRERTHAFWIEFAQIWVSLADHSQTQRQPLECLKRAGVCLSRAKQTREKIENAASTLSSAQKIEDVEVRAEVERAADRTWHRWNEIAASYGGETIDAIAALEYTVGAAVALNIGTSLSICPGAHPALTTSQDFKRRLSERDAGEVLEWQPP
jgi:hypothetical protein